MTLNTLGSLRPLSEKTKLLLIKEKYINNVTYMYVYMYGSTNRSNRDGKPGPRCPRINTYRELFLPLTDTINKYEYEYAYTDIYNHIYISGPNPGQSRARNAVVCAL